MAAAVVRTGGVSYTDGAAADWSSSTPRISPPFLMWGGPSRIFVSRKRMGHAGHPVPHRVSRGLLYFTKEEGLEGRPPVTP